MLPAGLRPYALSAVLPPWRMPWGMGLPLSLEPGAVGLSAVRWFD